MKAMKWMIVLLGLLLVVWSVSFAEDNQDEEGADNQSSYEKRKAEVPIDWKEVELIVIESPHDSFESELKKRGYPYYLFGQGDIKRFLERGGGAAVFVNEKGRKSKRKIAVNPRKQMILFGCSNFIPLKDPDIYRFRRFMADGGFIFTNCWGVMLLGQVTPDYLKTDLMNSNPPTDLMGPQKCKLLINPKTHDLFRGLEDMKKEITFEFSGARVATLIHEDIDKLFAVEKTGEIAMFHFQFKGDPKNWKDTTSGKPAAASSSGDEEEEPHFYGEVMNFLPHFVEQRAADARVADIRDTIFYNFVIRKQGLSNTIKAIKGK